MASAGCSNFPYFYTVASSMGVTISAPLGCFVSFTNSPYYSHEHGSAIDIYFQGDSEAFSPVKGRVSQIFKVNSPPSKYFKASSDEQLLIVQASDNPAFIVRILHVENATPTGTVLNVGDLIGTIPRSGFYDFWTDLHIHVEVRSPENVLRAKGSFGIVPETKNSKLITNSEKASPYFQIVEADDNYCLLDSEVGVASLSPFVGITCEVGGSYGILDAGIPHYRVGSIHLSSGAKVRQGDKVTLWGVSIGEVLEFRNRLAVFRSYPLEVLLNNQPVRGLSLFPWIGTHPFIKAIPFTPTRPRWTIGEYVQLKLNSLV